MPWWQKTLSDSWCCQSYFLGELFQRILNNSPQQWCTFCHCGRTGQWLPVALVILTEELLSWALRGFSVFATGRACCDHVFHLFAKTRPPNWLTVSFVTFADSLVTCMDFIQCVQMKGWRNDKSRVFYQETSLECNRGLFWPKALSTEFNFDFSGHPSVQNSCSFQHTSSSCWWSRISSNLNSVHVAGKPSRMLATYKFRSSLRHNYVRFCRRLSQWCSWNCLCND